MPLASYSLSLISYALLPYHFQRECSRPE